LNPDYKRTQQDLAYEYEAVLRTVAARKSRLPATEEGLVYAARMDAIAEGVACCVQADNPALLVATPEELEQAEAALIVARDALSTSLDGFLSLDTARKREATPAPQTVQVAAAARTPIANSAGG
jgi:hypothetical protein